MAKDRFEAMYEEYQQGATVKKVGEKHGISGSAVHAAFQRRGFKLRDHSSPRAKHSKLAGFDDSAFADFKKMWDALDSKIKGTIIEGNIKNKLAEKGFDVWCPYMNNHKADFGVLVGGRLLRIQAKAATYDTETKRFRAALQTRDKNKRHIKYKPEDVDFFIVQCAGLQEFYVVPAAVGIRNQSLNLLPHRERFKQRTADDWEIYRNRFDLLKK